MRPLILVGACGAFVAVLRNHAEIVLAHANRETPKSAALLFPQGSHSLAPYGPAGRGSAARRVGRREGPGGPRRGFPTRGTWPPSPVRRMGHARPPGLNRQKAATQTATHAARRTVEHYLDLCNLVCRARPHVMVRLLARVIGVGVETADMLVQEVLSRNLRDRRAVARYGGLTGSPDESGKKRREKGLARSGNARVRRGMIQLAWRFLMFQKDSALAHWFYARTKNAPQTRKTMIVALARKLLIALWRLAREDAIPEGIVLRPAL